MLRVVTYDMKKKNNDQWSISKHVMQNEGKHGPLDMHVPELGSSAQ
jgi:hypothetical protein